MATLVEESGTSNEHNIKVNGTNDMICAKCFIKGEENGAVGICKLCKYYLCSQCVDDHRKDDRHQSHQIAFFYCQTNLMVNKLVRANSFCLDCGHYLCQKCKMNHRGFREYRHHTFIGGKVGFNNPFEHSMTRKLVSSKSSSSRNSRMTKSTERESGRKSPYLGGIGNLPVLVPKKQSVSIEKPVYDRPRNLVKTTTGRLHGAVEHLRNTNESTVTAKNVHYDDEHVKSKAELIGEYDLKSEDDKTKCNIISSVFLNNDNLVVADNGNKNIKLYDSYFRNISSMNISTFPVALSACKQVSSELFASTGSSVLLLATSEGLSVKRKIEMDVPKIEGMAPWESGVAIVFKSYKSRADKKGHLEVHLLTYSGDIQYEITISSQFIVKMVTPIWYITTTNDGRELLLSDTNLNRIISIDIENWHVVYVLRGKSKGGAPRSLTMDLHGNLLVTWYGEVRKISKHGRDLGVPVSGIDKQSVIVYNQRTNNLIVHSWSKFQSDRFRVYQLT